MKKKLFALSFIGIILFAVSFFKFSILINKQQNVASADDLTNEYDNQVFSCLNETSEEVWPYGAMEQENIKTRLAEKYLGHTWQKSPYLKRSVQDLSGEEPVDMQANNSFFPQADVLEGLRQAKEENFMIETEYGGCGPIAVIGVFDYLARTFGYKEIMNNPTNREDRVALAKEVFLTIPSITLDSDSTFAFPAALSAGFEQIAKKHNLSMNAYEKTSLFGGNKVKDEFIDVIKERIDAGIPVTLCVGATNTNKGDFAGHCVTVFSYETWVGTDKETGERVFHTMFGTRLNSGSNRIYYASEDLLAKKMVSLVFYSITYQNYQEIKASDFATAFVNSNGQGQYFNTENEAEITLSNGYKFNTARLRCSYIENQYLVMSGIRKSNDASYKGEAYLEFHMNDNIKMIEFDIGLWSNKEGFLNSENETVTVECLVNGVWVKRKVFKPSDLSFLKDSPLRYRVYLKEGTAFRFVVNITPKASDRNKGRVVLDNISLYYH